ncbi:MAG: hypothetical protein BWY90_00548 [Deltaproteobacteria bacterium ADurb.BinA014]|nr:MAG: hypothetical protein BWY90_00548 [Deltaproteobacteria bacterium ADurb.BinA014]
MLDDSICAHIGKVFFDDAGTNDFIAKLLRMTRVAESVGIHQADKRSVTQKNDIAHHGVGFII